MTENSLKKRIWWEIREAEEEAEDAIFGKTKAHHNYLYNALPEIRLGRGDNVTTH